MDVPETNDDIAKISPEAAAYHRLYEIIRILRAQNGCPWDRAQTPLSMRQNIIEETFEAVDAISVGDVMHVREELGDVFLNATMIAYMFEQSGDFSLADTINELSEKLIRRHPHVFSASSGKSCMSGKVENSIEVLKQWDKIKEKVEGRGDTNSVMDEVPAGFPPLLRAYKILKKAAKKGFDFFDVQPEEKVKRSFLKLENTVSTAGGNKHTVPPFDSSADPETNNDSLLREEMIGDLLFSVINYSRCLAIDPVVALNNANEKFCHRFVAVEKSLNAAGIPMDSEHSDTIGSVWQENGEPL